MTDPARTGAVVLAAGAGSRFGGGKLLADLAGRPLLEHVLRTLRTAGLAQVVVVLGSDAAAIEAAVEWGGERRVLNPRPGDGLASSLKIGFAALDVETETLEAAFVVLGDQPLLAAGTLARLLAADTPPDRPFVVPSSIATEGRNPVLVRRPGWPLVASATGDRGLGPILAAHPELVTEVAVPDPNPDVDTLADLAAVAWADRVRANREQVDRHREVPDGPDFYGPVTSLFRADPHRTDDPTLDQLLALARPGETWLDIGAGAGRFALPLALHVGRVVAVEPSDGMRAALAEMMAEYAIPNIEVRADRWPPAGAGSPSIGSPAAVAPAATGSSSTGSPVVGTPHAPIEADVALIAHLGYDIEAIAPFLDAMEAAARRICVAVLMERQPSSVADAFWPPIHGEERVALPALPEFLDLLRVRGRRPEVVTSERSPRGFETVDQLHGFIRRQLWLVEGGTADRRLGALVRERAVERQGRWYADLRTTATGVVWWPAGATP